MSSERRATKLEARFFAFRAPALPMDVLTAWADGVQAPTASHDELPAALERDRALLRERLLHRVHQPEVMGALSVASPDLLDAFRDRPDDPGVEAALVRYVSRMASRATPFGLFAACGYGAIAERTHIELPALSQWRRQTRLDGDYLDRVVRARAAELRPSLRFRPNDSLYEIAGRRRYVQVRFDKMERTHHLAEVADSEHLKRALDAASDGATPPAIADALTAGGIASERAAGYVDQLIDAQVLVPELAVTVTGRPPLDALVDDLEAAGDGATAATLSAAREELAAIDAEGAAAAPERHAGVAEMLRDLAVPEERARLLQVDAIVPDCAATLARETVADVARGVELLRRIDRDSGPTALDRFRDAFLERYEQREVPLLEALDDDLGAGYTAGGDPAPLIKGLRRPRPEQEVAVGRREERLLVLMHRALTEGTREVVLTADDIAALENEYPRELPVAIGAIAVPARTAAGPRVLLQSAHGPAGASLLGRFCHADPQLAELVRDHLRAEEAHAPDAVHAEIVHLPSGLLSNILVRPVLREWELEWLGRSGAPRERRLPASDLLLSVRGGRFVLRSRRLDREVCPRLTSAHNWSRRSPAVYRFLAELQAQGTAGSVMWSWEPFRRAPFMPRVRWGRLVLAPAAWWVGHEELRALSAADPVERWRATQEWRAKRALPRCICLADGDNKLTIDLDNALSVDTFVRAVRSRDEAFVEELYPAPDELIAEGPDGRRALEVVIPLVRSADAARDAAEPAPARATSSARRTFPPGSEWTYLKLYTGSATADTLLRDAVGPLAARLVESGAADRWFFIRYGDPRHHLRVRFHGEPAALAGPVQQLAADALERGLAHDAQFGTYERELERYGGPEAIDVAERIFHADSDAVVRLLTMFERGEKGLDERWRIGLLGTHVLMRDLGLDEEDCAAQASGMLAAFEREFRPDAALRKGIAERMRSEFAAVDALLDVRADSDHALAPGIAVIAERSRRIEPLAVELAELRSSGRLGLSAEALADPLIHMWLDRLSRSENRFHEYVTYALLARVLRARTAHDRARR